MRPRTIQLTGVKWRCSLCPAEGTGATEVQAFWRYETHYARVHRDKE